jgi:hypothetical protein
MERQSPKAREEADAQDFQTDFLNIFGVSRRQVANFDLEKNNDFGYFILQDIKILNFKR